MLEKCSLGKTTAYAQHYSPELLFPVPRSLARDKIGFSTAVPFTGVDIWNGTELSWINLKGKPEIALVEFSFPHDSPNIVESKSFKLYLNSLNQTPFASIEEVQKTIKRDLNKVIEGDVTVNLIPYSGQIITLNDFQGVLLDKLDIETSIYSRDDSLLCVDDYPAEETVYSNLLKSNCMATGQPDWGSVLIRYKGPHIRHEALLKYIISFRSHVGFAEHCAEQMFFDLLTRCKPDKLTVYIRYTKRGGLDINPFRSNFEKPYANIRQPRQ